MAANSRDTHQDKSSSESLDHCGGMLVEWVDGEKLGVRIGVKNVLGPSGSTDIAVCAARAEAVLEAPR